MVYKYGSRIIYRYRIHFIIVSVVISLVVGLHIYRTRAKNDFELTKEHLGELTNLKPKQEINNNIDQSGLKNNNNNNNPSGILVDNLNGNSDNLNIWLEKLLKLRVQNDINKNVLVNNNNLINNNNNPQVNVKQQPPQNNAISNDMLGTLSKLERFIHIDLKGAPPKPDYYKTFIPLLKKHGATGILLEYEDMFPFKGVLEVVRNGNAYTEENVKSIISLAAENDLKIMPLVQTYGHLEWVLKNKKFKHLRDHADYPQVITPCLQESYDLIFDMLDQVITLHPNVPFFHIGCDEVYYKLVHNSCRSPQVQFNGDFSQAFMSHVIKVAAYVRKRLPQARIIIWDDMLHNIDEGTLKRHKPELDSNQIEPMIWAYVENVITWFQDDLYRKYGNIFEYVWSSSAFKGASSEYVTITSVNHHYLNHITWNEVMHRKTTDKLCKFRGIAITGWSRYDHFLQVCDLLPEAIPSLVYNLKTVQLGQIDSETRLKISQELGCKNMIPWTPEEVHDGFMSCTFPGHEVYEAILPIKGLLKSLDENLEYARKYMSPISINYNYAHRSRAEEVIGRLEFTYQSMIRFKNNFIKAGQTMYWDDTINEWLEVYFMPYLNNLHDYMKGIKKAMKETQWDPRPLPITIRNIPDVIQKK